MGQIIHEFKLLKKETFKYQEYIFDLEQENVKLKEMREEEFRRVREGLGREFGERVEGEV